MRSIKEVIEQSGYLDNGIQELTVLELYTLMLEYGGDVVDECAEEVRDEPWQISKEAVKAVKDQLK